MTILLLLLLQEDLDRTVPAILEQDQIPAAVIVLGTKDRVSYRKAFGTAKLDTLFDLASCTKVVGTTTAAMKLVEDGRLGLDEDVGKRLPGFEGLTPRKLLTHRTGLPAYLTPKGRDPDAILKEIAALQRDGKFRYS
jgi:CubicO group peptidase (beta-lactamase class C family)